jgi:hypothetical protein
VSGVYKLNERAAFRLSFGFEHGNALRFSQLLPLLKEVMGALSLSSSRVDFLARVKREDENAVSEHATAIIMAMTARAPILCIPSRWNNKMCLTYQESSILPSL